MKRVALHFCFKGSRNYVQGGDIYNAIVQAAAENSAENAIGTPFRLVIHRFTHTDCDMILDRSGSTESRPENPVAELTLHSADGQTNGWLVDTDRPINCRNPFDERSIERLCVMDKEKKEITIKGELVFSPIEIAISMTKQIHYALYPTPDKWIFTRLDLQRFFRKGDASNLLISVEHNFNNRLTKSKMSSGEEIIGYIYFSLIKK